LFRSSEPAAAGDSGAAWCALVIGRHRLGSMISIPITDEAYEALKARNPQTDQDQTSRGRSAGIWVDRTFLDQLLAARRPGESYSDVIMRQAS
jgi:hypothetical protein